MLLIDVRAHRLSDFYCGVVDGCITSAVDRCPKTEGVTQSEETQAPIVWKPIFVKYIVTVI